MGYGDWRCAIFKVLNKYLLKIKEDESSLQAESNHAWNCSALAAISWPLQLGPILNLDAKNWPTLIVACQLDSGLTRFTPYKAALRDSKSFQNPGIAKIDMMTTSPPSDCWTRGWCTNQSEENWWMFYAHIALLQNTQNAQNCWMLPPSFGALVCYACFWRQPADRPLFCRLKVSESKKFF